MHGLVTRLDRHLLLRSDYLLVECPVDGACSGCQPGVGGYTCDDAGECKVEVCE